MGEVHGRSGARFVTVACAGVLALLAGGCNRGDEPTTADDPQQDGGPASGSYAACLSWYEDDVESLAVSADGKRWLYLSDRRPSGLPEEASWSSGDLALYVRDRNDDGSTLRSRYIATSWDTSDEVSVYATPDLQGASSTDPLGLAESLRDVALSADGSSFLVAVDQVGIRGGYAKLYHGVVPPTEDTTSVLAPGEGGLTVVPINNLAATESIGNYAFSPDGTKVAAIVGPRSELRVYDVGTGTIYAYSLGEENEIVVENEMPQAAINIGVSRQPAISVSTGEVVWSPDSTRLAFSRPEGVGTMALYVFDFASGDLSLVSRFENATVPQVAWSADGASLFTMSTQLSTYQAYGNTQFRRIEAQENGSDLGSGATIVRSGAEFLNWKTEPANLVNLDDVHLFFTWEGRLYRMIAEGGDLGGAPFGPVTVFHLNDTLLDRGVSVEYERPFAAAAMDTIVFPVRDGARTRIGERTYATAATCPEIVAPEAVDGADQGEGEGDGEGQEETAPEE